MGKKPRGTTRRDLITASAVAAAALAPIAVARAQPTQAAPKTADFLFVQSAKGMTFDKNRNALTLTGVSPVRIFITDRP